MAPQLMAMKGPWRRALRLWMAWANISLPVPLSPRSRTLLSLLEACVPIWTALARALPLPMMSSKVKVAWAPLNRLISLLRRLMGFRKITPMVRRSCSSLTGFPEARQFDSSVRLPTLISTSLNGLPESSISRTGSDLSTCRVKGVPTTALAFNPKIFSATGLTCWMSPCASITTTPSDTVRKRLLRWLLSTLSSRFLAWTRSCCWMASAAATTMPRVCW